MLNICGFMLSPRSNKVLMSTHWSGVESEFLQLTTTCGDQCQQLTIGAPPNSSVTAQLSTRGQAAIADVRHGPCQSGWLETLTSQAHARLTPDDVITHIQPDQWLDWVTIHANNQLVSLMFNIFSLHGQPRRLAPLHRANYFYGSLHLLDQQLSLGGYLCGRQFTYADLNLWSILDPASLAEVDLTHYRHLQSWLMALKAQNIQLAVHRFNPTQSAMTLVRQEP